MNKTGAAKSTEPITSLRDHDVLLGRGGANNRHFGNGLLRQVALSHADEYRSAQKKDKTVLARRLVRHMHNLDPPTRFLRQVLGKEYWEEVNDETARVKTSQVLRDAVGAAFYSTEVTSSASKDDVETGESSRTTTDDMNIMDRTGVPYIYHPGQYYVPRHEEQQRHFRNYPSQYESPYHRVAPSPYWQTPHVPVHQHHPPPSHHYDRRVSAYHHPIEHSRSQPIDIHQSPLVRMNQSNKREREDDISIREYRSFRTTRPHVIHNNNIHSELPWRRAADRGEYSYTTPRQQPIVNSIAPAVSDEPPPVMNLTDSDLLREELMRSPSPLNTSLSGANNNDLMKGELAKSPTSSPY